MAFFMSNNRALRGLSHQVDTLPAHCPCSNSAHTLTYRHTYDMSRHMERTTVRLPSELLARARKKAAAEGRTLTSLIEQSLRETLVPRPRAPSQPKARAPTSSVAGRGLVDLSNSAHLQELMDDEVIRNAGLIKLR